MKEYRALLLQCSEQIDRKLTTVGPGLGEPGRILHLPVRSLADKFCCHKTWLAQRHPHHRSCLEAILGLLEHFIVSVELSRIPRTLWMRASWIFHVLHPDILISFGNCDTGLEASDSDYDLVDSVTREPVRRI